ncbi:hypothetical protein [Paraburkholderia youngii]|uniref:hypothetical protein n=1 Tax=Paraburkholderia youngii TaxID=2782701 RepID=UPI003D240A80
MSAALDSLVNDIETRKQAGRKPKGILVTPDLYKEMRGGGLIEKKLATPNGLPAPDLGIELPYYDGDVYVHVDPELESEYRLPTKP